jgi:hypothetical protein
MKSLLIMLSLILGTNGTSSAQVNENHLINKWVHDQEEVTNDKSQVYRPHDYKQFRPSRFTQVFEFKKEEECLYLYLHPTDRHSMEPGTWSFDTDTNLITIKDVDGTEIYFITVLILEKDKLVMTRN